jgi:hypothetical protein
MRQHRTSSVSPICTEKCNSQPKAIGITTRRLRGTRGQFRESQKSSTRARMNVCRRSSIRSLRPSPPQWVGLAVSRTIVQAHQGRIWVCVAVIEDDESICRSLVRLLRQTGLRPSAFQSAEGFFASPLRNGFGCLVLDENLDGGMSGLELRRRPTCLQRAWPPAGVLQTSCARTHDCRTARLYQLKSAPRSPGCFGSS